MRSSEMVIACDLFVMRSVLLPSRRLKEAAADSFFSGHSLGAGAARKRSEPGHERDPAPFVRLWFLDANDLRGPKLPSVADRLARMRQRADRGIGVPSDCAPGPEPRGSACARFCAAHGAAQARQGPPGKMDSQRGG